MLANDVSPSARSLYNVGICAELVGELALAHAAYEEYLATADDDANRRADALKRMESLKSKLALVTVMSSPSGAEIFVDRTELGAYGHTPRTIVVSPGKRRIEVALPDHNPASMVVEAVQGKSVAAGLSLRVKTGRLTVTTDPRGAMITVKGPRAQATRTQSGSTFELPVGRYRVEVSAPGYSPAETDVVVSEGSTTATEVVARALPVPTGRILVDTGAVHAKVFIDGKPAAMTPATVPSVPVGKHRITLRAPGHRAWTGMVKVRHDQSTFVNATLTKAAP